MFLDADTCALGTNVQLFVEILNHYVYYFENGNLEITDRYITGLVDLIREHLDALEASPLKQEVRHNHSSV